MPAATAAPEKSNPIFPLSPKQVRRLLGDGA